MNKDKTLIIIPAKGFSNRFPRKNVRKINNIELFLYSAYYAKKEGFKNIVVSSDDDEILELSKSNGFSIFKEIVNESKMEYCVNQVLEKYQNFEYVIVLQPTSPLRENNKINIMLERLSNSDLNTIITCQKFKPVAWYKDECLFDTKNRPLYQETKNFIYHFDGNILITKVNNLKKTNFLIDENSLIEENSFPYYLQIDDENEFNVIKCIIENLENCKLLPITP